ncbi:MAG: sensor histidine kinase [Flavobacteriales bacterium]
MKYLLLFSLLFLGLSINAQQEEIRIKQVFLHIDSSASESFEKVGDSAFQKNFHPIDLVYATGNNAFNFWFKLNIENSGKATDARISMEPTIMWKITKYSGKNFQDSAHAGFKYTNSHSPNVPIHLEHGDNICLMKIECFGGANGLNFFVSEEKKFEAAYDKKTFGLSFFYGIVAFIMAINLFYWITIKKNAFLYYAIYTLLTLVFYSSVDGIPYLGVFGPMGDFGRFNVLVVIVMYFAFLPLMSLEFLQISDKYPKLRKVSTYYFFFAVIAMIASYIWDSNEANEYYFSYHNLTCFFGILLLLIITILGYKQKNILSRSFIIAFTLLTGTFIISSLESYGTTDYGGGWQIAKTGSAIEVIILSLALALNFRNTEMKYQKVQQEYSHLEYSFLRTQMNPHFLFNILGAIKNRIMKKDNDGALELVDKFSGMVRQVVDSSRQEFIPLKQEIKFLEDYIGLQSRNYGDRFSFSIHTDKSINVENVMVPNMIIQPFVENAFVHGFPSVNDRKLVLEIYFRIENSLLLCVIKDNGSGLHQKTGSIDRKSIGIKNSRERLNNLSKKLKQDFGSNVNNRSDETGTIVELRLPFDVE